MPIDVAGERSRGARAARAMSLPGIDVDLRKILHAGQAITLHEQIPTNGTVRTPSHGIVCKAIIDELPGGDAARGRAYAVRFAGMLAPGETIRSRVWPDGSTLELQASCPERNGAPVHTHAEMDVQ